MVAVAKGVMKGVVKGVAEDAVAASALVTRRRG